MVGRGAHKLGGRESYTFYLRPPLIFDTIERGVFMPRRHTPSDNEKVAMKIAKLINDLTLDLDEIGVYLGRMAPSVSYRRLQIIAEAAQHEREAQDVRFGHDPLF
jgi:hypothetical protein